MKRLFLASLALVVSACTGPPLGLPGALPKSTSADAVVLTAERGFAVAELALLTTVDGLGRAVRNGIVKGNNATWARARLAKARRLAVKGKTTVDRAEKAAVATEILGITAAVDALTGRK